MLKDTIVYVFSLLQCHKSRWKRKRLGNQLLPQLETAKKDFSERKKYMFFFFSENSAEERQESSMLAKRFVSSESQWGFDKNNLEKSRIETIFCLVLLRNFALD